jgi:hypothetical protein
LDNAKNSTTTIELTTTDTGPTPVSVNTYASPDAPSEFVTTGSGVSVESVTGETDPLSPGTYNLTLRSEHGAEIATDTATVTVAPRSTGNLTAYTTRAVSPAGFENATEIREAIADGTLTPATTATANDTVVYGVNASGLTGLPAAANGPLERGEDLALLDGLSFGMAPTATDDANGSTDGGTLGRTPNESAVHLDRDGLFLVADGERAFGTETPPDPGETFEGTFRVDDRRLRETAADNRHRVTTNLTYGTLDSTESPAENATSGESTAGNQSVSGNETVETNQSVGGNETVETNQSVGGNETVETIQSVGGNETVGTNQSVSGNNTVETNQSVGGNGSTGVSASDEPEATNPLGTSADSGASGGGSASGDGPGGGGSVGSDGPAGGGSAGGSESGGTASDAGGDPDSAASVDAADGNSSTPSGGASDSDANRSTHPPGAGISVPSDSRDIPPSAGPTDRFGAGGPEPGSDGSRSEEPSGGGQPDIDYSDESADAASADSNESPASPGESDSSSDEAAPSDLGYDDAPIRSTAYDLPGFGALVSGAAIAGASLLGRRRGRDP